MGTNHTHLQPSLLAWLLSMCPVPVWWLSYPFEKSPLWCHLPLLVSAWLSTQSNSPTSPESICAMARCGPSLLPAPGVTQFPNFLGTVLASDPRPCWGMLLAVCRLLPFHPPRIFASRSLLAWVWDFLAHGGEGAACWLSLTWLSSHAAAAAIVSSARPGDLPIGLQNLLTAQF